MEKFRKCRFADVGKSELGKKETCAKHKIDWSQNGRSNYVKMADDKVEVLACTSLILAGVDAAIDRRKRKRKHETLVDAYIRNRIIKVSLVHLTRCCRSSVLAEVFPISTHGSCNFRGVVRTG